ncbi:hypothetical protein HCN44_010895 [Aphidius gifuensis]|uniref:HAT C-terminal dimerisation domain-containing protein n=1 Tax=Aphidius gifuensis TaxID=684658 RepID=A0A834Y5Z1_APHGI|nr:hypothetical protein HCN44_010895 [Aphidius gifuensis]
MKCTCHSLNLCCSNAAKFIPEDTEYLVRELYNFFSFSSLRTLKYQETFDLLNTGINSKPFRKSIKIADTRWLSYGAAVKRVMEQWHELKLHFKLIASKEGDKANLIYTKMKDDSNRLYLVFLNPILDQMNSLNIKFQSDKFDVGSAYTDMATTFMSLASRILKPLFMTQASISQNLLSQVMAAVTNPLAYLSIDNINYGTEFSQELQKSSLSSEVMKRLKKDCCNYLIRLLYEMKNRLPENMEKFEKFKLLKPKECLKTAERKKFKVLWEVIKDFVNPEVSINVHESQWDKLPFVNWKHYFPKEIIPTNIILFWPEVFKFQDAAGDLFFKELAETVIRMLSIPTSNACAERVFSVMKLTKTILRNQMQYELLVAIMRLVIYMNVFKMTSKTFQPTNDMLKRFNTATMYSCTKNISEADQREETDVFDCVNEFDNCIVTGALVRLDPHRVRVGEAPPRVKILRGILSNLQGREIRLLIWDKRVAEFEYRIFCQVLRINRPKVVVANPQYFDPGQNLMPLELSVQTSTFIDIVGPMVEEIPVMPDIPSYELSAIGNILGAVRLVAFIRYPIERQVVGNYSFGSGAITDGVHHLCVNVAGAQGPSHAAGTHNVVTGDLRRNNYETIVLQVADMANI